MAVLIKGARRPPNVRDVLSDAAYRHVLARVHIRPLAAMADDVSDVGPHPVARNIARDGIVIG